jgi:transposase-like protein
MEALQLIEEILNRVFKWHRFPISLKAEAVLLYFKGLSLRAVREFLLHKGYKVSIETIREWFHAVGKALQVKVSTFGIHKLVWLTVSKRFS